MVQRDLIIELSTLDLDHVEADIDEIRQYNPQRHEMEHLSAVIHIDRDKHIIVGYKDITNEEFWARGHMPGMPLMPASLCAKQLRSLPRSIRNDTTC